jgi:hypothetical protein
MRCKDLEHDPVLIESGASEEQPVPKLPLRAEELNRRICLVARHPGSIDLREALPNTGAEQRLDAALSWQRLFRSQIRRSQRRVG